MAAIQKVAKQAWNIFRVFIRDKSGNHEHIRSLQEALTAIRASDLNIETTRDQEGVEQDLASSPAASPPSAAAGGDFARTAPVGYMHIFEDGVMTMGVFIIREGGRIPLHNHPGMHGLLKVLYGNIKIKTFSTVTEDWAKFPAPQFEGFPANEPPKSHLLVPTRLGIDQYLTSSSEAAVLTPREENYHSLESVGGTAAFLDILSPPYDPVIGRDCYYFKELKALETTSSSIQTSADNKSSTISWLMEVSQPDEFWCDEVDYPGSDVELPDS